MRPFRDLPIRRKVGYLLVATSAIVLVITGTSFIGYEWLTVRRAVLAHLTTISQIVADTSTAALRFRNETESAGLLSSLKAEPTVTYAGLFDEKGVLFAAYPERSAAPTSLPDFNGRLHHFESGSVWLATPVVQEGERYGTLVTRASLASAYRRLASYGVVVLLILILSYVAAFGLSSRLQTGITAPILELARAAREVAARRDYGIRAARYGHDELGALTDDFNHMLSELRAGQQEIQRLNTDLERRVALRTRELNQTNTELEAFTYSVSHDLRAPLRHISDYVEAVREDSQSQLSSDSTRFLERIHFASDRLRTLVDALLRLSRVGRQPLACAPTDLDHVVDAVIRELEAESRGRDVEWVRHPLPTANCDAALMALVFTNLLSNALKYTRPRPRAVITIGFIPDAREPAIFVRDNGVGYDPAFQNRLFGVFERLHSSTEFEGHGIGLATAQRVIRNHGGRIWADGRLNEGATFYFTIPGLEPYSATRR